MKNKKVNKKRDWKKIVSRLLFIILILSIIYASVKIVTTPSEVVTTEAYVKVKSDYVLMLIQCILGLIVMLIPSAVEHRWCIDIPNKMEILYFIFLFCAIYLGEVRDFYYVVPYWDSVLHAFSGGMLGALGFSLVSFLNDSDKLQFELSPFFVALFAFCFALSAGTVWEIYEYTFDGLMFLNMQKFALQDGTLLVGHAALADTMKDLIVDALSALIISVIGYFSLKNGDIFDLFINKSKKTIDKDENIV